MQIKAEEKENMKISIIIPSFNQGCFIKESIDSILNQDWPEKEIIVMDGGSKDETISILKSYGNRIIWFSEKDNGQTDAINKGLRKATGEVVAYLNSDDYYLDGALSFVGNYFKNHSESMWLTGNCRIVDENGKEIHQLINYYRRFLKALPFSWLIYVVNYIAQPSTFWRRTVIEKVGYFDENKRYTMDYDYWLRIIKLYPPARVNRTLSTFRIHNKSKGKTQYLEQFKEDLQTMQSHCNSRILYNLHKLHNFLITSAYRIIK